jgi:hypothetical protein
MSSLVLSSANFWKTQRLVSIVCVAGSSCKDWFPARYSGSLFYVPLGRRRHSSHWSKCGGALGQRSASRTCHTSSTREWQDRVQVSFPHWIRSHSKIGSHLIELNALCLRDRSSKSTSLDCSFRCCRWSLFLLRSISLRLRSGRTVASRAWTRPTPSLKLVFKSKKASFIINLNGFLNALRYIASNGNL